MTAFIGQTLSHYRIVERIGRGGMGEVYLARDERLERDVALKVLSWGALAGNEARKQFRKEALAISRLNHPNIATVHDFDSQAGVDFIVMELVRGKTLAERISEEAIPEPEIARLGEQLAEGLASAHRAGVLHRDVKPSNLSVTSEGLLKILDFGLARLVPVGDADGATVTNLLSGTVPYMAPEQLRGERVDERADVWGAGAVLYEMATGRRPFKREPQALLITEILHGAPDSPCRVDPRVSQAMERIILKCLEKNPAARYQTARELSLELRGMVGGPPSRRSKGSAWHSRYGARRWVVGAAIGVLAGAAGLLVALNVGRLRDRVLGNGAVTEVPLAVLPLANLSGDPAQEYFADGMTDELITRLAQVSALRVISRTSVMQYKGTRKPLKRIAHELGVGVVVEGTVARADSLVRISARLVNVETDRTIWSEGYERTLSNVLMLQSEVARAIVEKVRVGVTPGERLRLEAARKVDPRVHEEYLRGLAEYGQYAGESYRSALQHFRRAVEMDPSYAPAHAGMAATYAYLSGMWLDPSEAIPRARASALKAIQIDPNLASAYAVLAYVKAAGDWDWSGAEQGFRHAIAINPSDVLSRQNYGALLVVQGRFAEARDEFSRARQIDPLSPLTATMSLWPLFEGRRYGDAIRESRILVSMDSTANSPRMILGQALTMTGDYDAAITELRKAEELDPSNPFPLGWLALAYGAAGRRVDALGLLHQLRDEERRGKYIQPYTYALVYVGLGEKQTALDWLEKGFATHSDEMAFLKVDPGLDPLRNELRFQRLLSRMEFPSLAARKPGG